MGGDYGEMAVRTLGVFGLTPEDAARRHATIGDAAGGHAGTIDSRLRPGRIALVRGPSGSGKSLTLRALAERVRSAGGGVVVAPARIEDARSRVIELFTRRASKIPDALRALSAAGLADAFVPARRVGELSEGQRARLSVAMAMWEVDQTTRAAGSPPLGAATGPHPGARPGRLVAKRDRTGGTRTVIIDELASTLDRTTGEGLCITLARWVRSRTNVRLVAASAREEVSGWLAPDLVVDVGPASPRSPGAAPTIAVGTFEDYKRLAHLHYRDGPPATCARVLAVRLAGDDAPIGVLVASMPTLNGAWRSRAWPGDYDGLSARRAASRLNDDLRCIARLIVDPRFRGRGLGAALVRAYLRDPLTRRTEAVAAMGCACPVFARAGMREWILETSVRDRRLTTALDAAGIEPWRLAEGNGVLARLERDRGLVSSLRTWARAHGPTRALASGPVPEIVRAAARSLIVRPRAYTAG